MSDSRHAGVCRDVGRAAARKSTYCHLSSFGPALFEIWWPDIYLGGPYGPLKDKMYWPGGLKSGPGQCLCLLMSRASATRQSILSSVILAQFSMREKKLPVEVGDILEGPEYKIHLEYPVQH